MKGKPKRKIPLESSPFVLNMLQDLREVLAGNKKIEDLPVFYDNNKKVDRHGEFWSLEEDQICELLDKIYTNKFGRETNKDEKALRLPFRTSHQVHGHFSKKNQANYHRDVEQQQNNQSLTLPNKRKSRKNTVSVQYEMNEKIIQSPKNKRKIGKQIHDIEPSQNFDSKPLKVGKKIAKSIHDKRGRPRKLNFHYMDNIPYFFVTTDKCLKDLLKVSSFDST